MAKIIGVKGDTVQIGTESGKIVEVNKSFLNFMPQIGDEIEIFRGNGKAIISKKKVTETNIIDNSQKQNQGKSNSKNKKNVKKKNPNTKLIIACLTIGIFIGVASATYGNKDDKKEDDDTTQSELNTSDETPYSYSQIQPEPEINEYVNDSSTDYENDVQGETGVKVQNKNGVIDDFEYRIDGGTIYLIEYDGEEDCVELETSYIVDGVQYQSDISSFRAYGGYTKLIIHEGFYEVPTPIFNSSDVKEVFFPRSMTNVFDYTLAYMHNYDDKKTKIYYAGTKEEWLNIFTKYKRTKVEDAEFGEELGIALGDKVNELIGVTYDSSDYEYFFSASPDDLR